VKNEGPGEQPITLIYKGF